MIFGKSPHDFTSMSADSTLETKHYQSRFMKSTMKTGEPLGEGWPAAKLRPLDLGVGTTVHRVSYTARPVRTASVVQVRQPVYKKSVALEELRERAW